MNIIYLILLIWNFFVFCIFGVDKFRAKKSYNRIRERTLLILAFLMGGIGCLFSMVIFNHKTSKMKFRILVPVAVVLNVLIFYFATVVKGL
jgi:uncharacterized membrane protein YsdA (DUF1294 family)